MHKTCLLFLLSFLFLHPLIAQQSKQYSFTNYGVENGLAAYKTSSVVQDETGYMWIGTINGLQRFDGTRFLTFRNEPANSNSLPDNHVEQLLIDREQNLWVVLNDGSVGTFDKKKFIFRPARVKTSNAYNLQAIRKLSIDTEGNIFYIFFNTELLTYSSKTNEFSQSNNFLPLPLNWKIVGLTQDPVTKKYWIGTDSGLAVYNKQTKLLSYAGHNLEQEPLIETFGKVAGINCYGIDRKRRFWFISWPVNVGASRIYCYDLAKNEAVLNAYDLVLVAKKYIEPDFFLEQEDGSIWLSGLNVFVKFNEAEKVFQEVYNGYRNDQSIYYERAYVFEDKERNVWAATSNNGLYVFNPARQLFSSYKHTNRVANVPGTGYLLSFSANRNRTIFAAVWGDGIYRYDSAFNNIPLNIKGIDEVNGLPVWDICPLNDQRTTWLVGQPGFIYVYDEITGIAKRYEPAIFEGRTIRQAVQDRQGNIWLGSNSMGLVKWDAAKGAVDFETGFSIIAAIPRVRVKNICIDHKGAVWVATNKEGVFKLDPITDTVIDHLSRGTHWSKRLLNNDVSALYEFDDTTMVIASTGLNIYNTKTNVVMNITAADGLPSNSIVSIEKDKAGYLWLGLMNGLCRMNLQKRTYTLFDRSDGMGNDNFQVAASTHLPDGRMLFGASDEFVVFDPNEIITTTQPPDVKITGFKVLEKPLLVDSLLNLNRIELSADDNLITINFSGLSYINKSKIVYYYQLENIDKGWRKADELNQAVYNYLEPGRYVFNVRAENADGVSSQHITRLVIRIRPPFWKTWWFICFLGFVGIGILSWFDRFRVGRIRETERVRTRIATSLTKDMSTTLGNINLLSEMASLKVEKDTDRTKDYISQISNNSNRMIEVMDDMIWSINPENDELQYTITRMRKYAAQLQSKYKLEISFSVDEKVRELKLQMDKRHEFFQVFKEALLNACIHAKSKFVAVSVLYQKATLTLIVTDDGRGFDTEEISFGRGLAEMRKRAALLKADLDVRSELNNGTTVSLVIRV